MTQVARIEPGNSEGNTLADRMKYAQALASASLLPSAYRQNPGNVLLAMELGDALGIRPIQAINAIHVIDGKPSASADLIASLIRKAGHRLRVKGDDQQATAQIIRIDDPEFTFEATWTIERAKAAGLASKAVWKQYPAAMLKARAITEVAREGASDALYGVIYTPEEIGAEVNRDGDPIENRPQQRRPGMAGLRDAVAKDEPVDAEVVTEEPAPLVNMTTGEVRDTNNPPMGTDPGYDRNTGDTLIDPRGQQMKALQAGMKEAGLGDRVAAIAFMSDVLDRPVESSKTLTRSEAGRVLDELQRMAEGRPFPTEPPLEATS